jgi:hypothetical protein
VHRSTFPAIAIAAGLLGTTLTSSAAPAPDVKRLDGDAPAQVLFVGNSYFYYNDSLHNHVRRMAAATGEAKLSQFKFRSITISGGSLNHHPIGHYLTPGAIGYEQPFDIVVLQGHSAAGLDTKRAQAFRAAVNSADALIRQHGAKTALYMTHAYADGHKRYDPANTEKIATLYVETANAIGAIVLPVGLAFDEAMRRHPELKLHQHYDNSHPTLAGSYLAACVVYASLYGKSPVGNPYDYFGKIDKQTVTLLQQVADDTVRRFFAR